MVQAIHFVLGAPGAPVLLSLPTTKSGQRLQDAAEAVVISDATVIAYISAVVPRLRPGERLWPQSAASFFLIFSNGFAPTLVFPPSAGGNTLFDGEVPLHTS